MILLWYNYVIRSTSISLPSARITSTASATIPTCVMFIIDCDFCDFCEKCEFRKSHISHISQFAHYLFRLLFFYIFLSQPFEYHWIAYILSAIFPLCSMPLQGLRLVSLPPAWWRPWEACGSWDRLNDLSKRFWFFVYFMYLCRQNQQSCSTQTHKIRLN